MNLTVTERAIIDLEKQKEAFMARAKNYVPGASINATTRDTILTEAALEALAGPVRIEITFKDPIHTRQQLEALMAACTEALVVTQDHQRGIRRQRMDLRHIMKTAAETLVYMNGKTPTGRKKLAPSSNSR
jgi:hypothetical protein